MPFFDDNNSLIALLILCLASIYLLFKIRRFSNGFPFIEDPKYNDICIVCSAEICCTVTLMQNAALPSPILVLLWFTLIFLSIFPFFWIKKTIKRKYKDTLITKEIDELKSQIDKSKEEQEKIAEENRRLSSIIHKDNKLMNAMLMAVDRLIAETANEEEPSLRKEKCGDISAQLQQIAGERAKELADYEFKGHPLPTTGNSRIDSLLAYIHRRAFQEGIAFEMSVDRHFMKELSGRITDEELSTLLADLLENAIIAIRPCKKKNLLLSLDLPQGYPVLAVYDSGVPFPEEVRAAWGKCRLTTHADTGGSGIGMMTTYEICTKNRAEFLIEDSLPGEQFTKRISVSFPEDQTNPPA